MPLPKKKAVIKSIWVISDGVPGNELRSFALAEAIRDDFIVKRVESSLALSWLPGIFQKIFVDLTFTNIGKKLINVASPWYLSYAKNEKNALSQPFPDLVISCGETTVATSLVLKKLTNKTDFVHIGHPRIPFGSFNSVLLQKHELLKLVHLGPSLSQQKGLIVTQLSLSNITADLLTKYHQNAAKVFGNLFTIKNPLSPVIGLLIGNSSPEYFFLNEDFKKLFKSLEILVKKYKARLLVNYSPRAPKFLRKKLDVVLKRLQNEGYPIMYVPENNQDAYLAMLATSSYFIVPLCSVNLLSEAIMTRKPVYLIDDNQSKGSLSVLGQRLIHNCWARRFRVSPRYQPPGDPLSFIGEHPDFKPIPAYPSLQEKAATELLELLYEQRKNK